MYEVGTVLARKVPVEDPAAHDFSYNEVEVLGESPVRHAATAEWSGTAAGGVIIRPLTAFDATQDEPFGKLQLLYDVKSLPPVITEVPAMIQLPKPTISPEDIFKEVAGVPDPIKPKRTPRNV